MNIFIHPTAEVSPGAEIGDGTKIWNQAQVREDSRIGTDCIISKNVYIDIGVRIGSRVKIQNNVNVYHGVTVEDDGVGFDPEAALNDGRPHVGMQNVRQRLDSMCGGKLVVSSEPGKGTKAVVTIPRKA